MAQGIRSKSVLYSLFSAIGNDSANTSDSSDQVSQRLSFLESFYNTYSNGDQHLQQSSRFPNDDSHIYHSDSKSVILKTSFGSL